MFKNLINKFKNPKMKSSFDDDQTKLNPEEFILSLEDSEDLKLSYLENKKILVKQDEQHSEFLKAQELIDDGKLKEGITILEKIMYEDGLVMVGRSWPTLLGEVYYKQNMIDECEKYIDFIYKEFPKHRDKTEQLKVKLEKKKLKLKKNKI